MNNAPTAPAASTLFVVGVRNPMTHRNSVRRVRSTDRMAVIRSIIATGVLVDYCRPAAD